jgi:hypothetical protein
MGERIRLVRECSTAAQDYADRCQTRGASEVIESFHGLWALWSRRSQTCLFISGASERQVTRTTSPFVETYGVLGVDERNRRLFRQSVQCTHQLARRDG